MRENLVDAPRKAWIKTVCISIVSIMAVILTAFFVLLIVDETGVGRAFGAVAYLILFIGAGGGTATVISLAFSIYGLIYTLRLKKVMPERVKKGDVIWYSVLTALPVFIEILFVILTLVVVK